MAKAITQLREKLADGTYVSNDIGAKAENVIYDNTTSLKTKLNDIDQAIATIVDNIAPEKIGFGYAVSSSEAVATQTAALQDYKLIKNGFVSVKFENNVPANATLNINEQGAKSIYYKGSAITAGIITANTICTFVYDGSYYHLLSIDRENFSIALNSGVLEINY